jgi:hypothetical protein
MFEGHGFDLSFGEQGFAQKDGLDEHGVTFWTLYFRKNWKSVL